MIYSVRHTTTFRYEPAVRESVMEVRLQPRSDGEQLSQLYTRRRPGGEHYAVPRFHRKHGASFRHRGQPHAGESHGAVGGGGAKPQRRPPPRAAGGGGG